MLNLSARTKLKLKFGGLSSTDITAVSLDLMHHACVAAAPIVAIIMNHLAAHRF